MKDRVDNVKSFSFFQPCFLKNKNGRAALKEEQRLFKMSLEEWRINAA